MDNFHMDVTVPVKVDGRFAVDLDVLLEVEVLSLGHNGSSDEPPEGPEWEIEDIYLTVIGSDGRRTHIPYPKRNFIPAFVVHQYMDTDEGKQLVLDQIHQHRLGC